MASLDRKRLSFTAGVLACVLLVPAAGKGDTLFVSSFSPGEITRVDLATGARTTIVSGLSLPEDGACSPSGFIYFAESTSDTITRWKQDGTDATNIVPTAGSVSGPEGLSFDPAGNLFFNTREIFFGADGAWRLKDGDPTNPVVQIVAPFTEFGEGSDIVVAGPHQGALLLVARAEEQVYISEPPGSPLKLFIDAPSFPSPARLYGIVTNGCGEVFVSVSPDTGDPADVFHFDAEGKFLEVYATGLGQANYLDFDSDGNLYVADGINGVIWKVTPAKVMTSFVAIDDPNGVAICRDRAIPRCKITCDAGGPYQAECTGAETCLGLDATRSDSGGAPLVYQWTSDCPGAKLDDPTLAKPKLCVDTSALGCAVTCTATVTVTDGPLTDTCTSPVRIADTLPPVLSGCLLKPAAPPKPASSPRSPGSGSSHDWLAPFHAPAPPAAPRSPRSPRSPASPCSVTSASAVQVVCGTAADACDAKPAIEAKVVLTRHGLDGKGGCVLETEELAVACNDVLQLLRVAAPCPAVPPKSPRSAKSPASSPPPGSGPLVHTYETIRLEVKAKDACGNASAICVDDGFGLSSCVPPPARCPVPTCGN